ncbi:MAG: hypothetical protein FWH34_02850 [Desulfovibrionaceae bacterium]|nr:hypothetical protein [Desulfovibrionaceae bacterium]
MRYVATTAILFCLFLCAGCAELDRNVSAFTGVRPSPSSMTGMTEQDLLHQWGVPDASYTDSQGNRHLSYRYEQETNYGSTPRRAQDSHIPVHHRDTYTEKTKSSTRTESSSPGQYTTRTETTKTGSDVRWSAPDPAHVPGYISALTCSTTFVVRDGVIRDSITRGPCW